MTTNDGTTALPDPAVAEQLVELAQRLRDQAVAIDAQRQAERPAPARTSTTTTTTEPTGAGAREAQRRYGSTERS